MPSYAKNGIEHQTLVQSNLRVFGGRFVFTPSANYREFWDFQSQNRAWNPITEKVDTTEVKGFRTGRDMSVAGNVSFNFFGYYKFKGKSAVKFRHVASPTLKSIPREKQPSIPLSNKVYTATVRAAPQADSILG